MKLKAVAKARGDSAPGLTVLAMAMFGLTPLLAYLGPLGFAPLISIAGLLAAASLWKPRAEVWPMLILLALVAWALITYQWSPATPSPRDDKFDHITGLKLVLQAGLYPALVLALGGLPERPARRVALVLAFGVLALALFLLLDAAQDAAIYQALRRAIHDPQRWDYAKVNIAQATYVLALLIFPASLAFERIGWRPGILVLVVCTAVAAHLLGADAPVAALAIGGAAWATVRLAGRRGALGLAVVVALGFPLAPLVMIEGVRSGLVAFAHEHMGPSWDARLDIWSFAASQIAQHPLRGWGLDASRTFGDAIPLHTHDAELQLWLELGAPGVILAGVFVVWVATAILRLSAHSRAQAAVAAGALFSYLTIGAVSFGVWQEWWLALGALTFCACVVVQRGWPNADAPLDSAL